MSETLIKALQNSALYPHEVTQFSVIETHLSWVILTGSFAYKIKKPLNLGFQDFTTLAQRKFFCELEMHLNQRLAPQLYLEIVAITGNEQHPTLAEKEKPVIEYAIKMHQFPQENLLTFYASHHQLDKKLFDALALQCAHFHQSAQMADCHTLFGTPDEILTPMQDNFTMLKKLPASAPFLSQIEKIEQWTLYQFKKLTPLLTQRKTEGFIRACHGDLHLGNIVMHNQHPLIFDCIEFNENFRWTDVMNDISFLAMDLDHKGYANLSAFFVNKYLEYTNDNTGVLLLKFYQCYRAMVRAKITSFHINQIVEDSSTKIKLYQEMQTLLALGEHYAQPNKASLTITMGLSGSGKTLFTEQLLMQTGAIRLRSDIIRKYLHTLTPYQQSNPNQKQAIYSSETTATVYQQLNTIAEQLLQGGYSVIIDAACLKKWQRELFLTLSTTLNIPLTLLSFDAPLPILQQRIINRLKHGKDASEADLSVLQWQLNEIEDLTDNEQELTRHVLPQIIEELILNNQKEKKSCVN